MLHSQYSTSDPLKMANYIFLGNPGAGKSTILNTVAGSTRFHSGVSLGAGLTHVCQQFSDHTGNLYTDTPGLTDLALLKKALLEISKAFRSSEQVKPIFVLSLEAGNFRSMDIVVMSVILQVLKKDNVERTNHYGIILNKLTERSYQFHSNGSEIRKCMKSYDKAFPQTEHILYLKEEKHAVDEDNKILNCQEDLMYFLSKIPPMKIYDGIDLSEHDFKRELEYMDTLDQSTWDVTQSRRNDGKQQQHGGIMNHGQGNQSQPNSKNQRPRIDANKRKNHSKSHNYQGDSNIPHQGTSQGSSGRPSKHNSNNFLKKIEDGVNQIKTVIASVTMPYDYDSDDARPSTNLVHQNATYAHKSVASEHNQDNQFSNQFQGHAETLQDTTRTHQKQERSNSPSENPKEKIEPRQQGQQVQGTSVERKETHVRGLPDVVAMNELETTRNNGVKAEEQRSGTKKETPSNLGGNWVEHQQPTNEEIDAIYLG